ncbi:endonuclease III [Psychrosphaera sp. F3M07]|nr:endonuclease III [Psychrosphaera sp. F3M07]
MHDLPASAFPYARKVVPAEFKVDVHHWLILHGRYICVARKPKCGACIIEDLCEFKDKTD